MQTLFIGWITILAAAFHLPYSTYLHLQQTRYMEWIFTLEDIMETALAFRQRYAACRVFAFHAPMGAGKTTFIHALCRAMQVSSAVSSPTFSIINEYAGPEGIVYHLDLYRLQGEEEAIRAGVEDCLYSGHTCLAEWPERAPALFPDDSLHVYLDVVDAHAQTRRMQVADK